MHKWDLSQECKDCFIFLKIILIYISWWKKDKIYYDYSMDTEETLDKTQ